MIFIAFVVFARHIYCLQPIDNRLYANYSVVKMYDHRTLRECLDDLPDEIVLALCLIVGAYAVSELIWRMVT